VLRPGRQFFDHLVDFLVELLMVENLGDGVFLSQGHNIKA
jgi:hypothetical protein